MTPELDLLRPALEMAIIVARQGESAPVRVPAPAALRPFLRFTRLPPRALSAALVALDDDGFRRRVADRSDEEEVGHAGWLLLTRPEGWDDELAALVEAHEPEGGSDSSGRDATRARRRAEAQQRRIGEQADELARLRARVAELQHSAAEVAAALAAAEQVAATAVAERTRAVRELKDVERRLAERTAQVRALESAGGVEVPSPAPDPAPPPDPSTDRAWDDAAALVADLRHDWAGFGEVLARLEAVVPPDAAPTLEHPRDLSSGKRQSSAGARSAGARRRAVRLGRGLVDGTPEAALWLLGRPGALALVDGYNVTMLAWPDLTVLEQRRRLEQAATDLQQRTGARMVLVFDGDDEGGAAVRAAVGSPVRVRFTHRDVEADDEILAMVETADADVLVVVSNDARVVEGARERGANVVRSTELVALVR